MDGTCRNCERLESEVERLRSVIVQAVKWFESPRHDGGVLWQDAADWCRRWGLDEFSAGQDDAGSD